MTRGEVKVPGLGPAGVVNVLYTMHMYAAKYIMMYHEYDEILFCNDT